MQGAPPLTQVDPILYYPSIADAGIDIQAGRLDDAIPHLENAKVMGPGARLARRSDRTRALSYLEQAFASDSRWPGWLEDDLEDP